ncbi:hypothetical protein [Asticcacaulis machinosus]|uniref:Uncharacterized protein n=1 Tax=Asticcacaulis machinosus TaxID=2984211 RepID=A0ABT5HHL5_9CAUL|nr:hypothetical protein [Asticcacaulis machinosus]MDC7675734.1 hypothetical protein [Asticcacaulis machinosus]
MDKSKQPQVVRFSVAKWLLLSAITGFLWFPITFGSMIIPYVGSQIAVGFVFTPIIYLMIFVGRANDSKKQNGLPTTVAIWALGFLQLIIIFVSLLVFVTLVSSLPNGRDWIDIGAHIA